MPETTTPDTSQLPDYAAMTALSVTQFWWIALPDGQKLGPFAAQDAALARYNEVYDKAVSVGLGATFVAGTRIVTTVRHHLESPPEDDPYATALAQRVFGGGPR
ncbi:hypothetical protein [Nocardia farcinica]|uniref:hypothetical protein n=1 Tax=Nocardia farcinica TaxID=37329 RepID=UPI003424942E